MTDWDRGSPAVIRNQDLTYGTEYTEIDLNSTGTTDVLNKSQAVKVHLAKMTNGGGTAVADLEVTDGSSTVKIDDNGTGGADIKKEKTFTLDSSEKLQVNVTTAEGSSQKNDIVISFEGAEHARDF